MWYLTCENTYIFLEEIFTLLQGILLALTQIDSNSFTFQSGKPNFAALVFCFCKSASFSPRNIFFKIDIKFLEVFFYILMNNIS